MENTVYTPEQLGSVLKGFRKSKKLSQTQAGSRVGLLQKTVSSLEKETSKSSIESLFKFISALELELVIRPKYQEDNNSKDIEW